MSTYVLVHAAWHGAWSWKETAKTLRDEGNIVYTPTLSGLGDRAYELNADINLSTHIQDILGLFRFEELEDVILVGHSYSGLVITAIADLLPDKIKALIYVDAMVPEEGGEQISNMCLMDFMKEAKKESFLKNAKVKGGGFKIPSPDSAYFDIDPRKREWVNSLLVPQPIATFTEKLHLTGAWQTIGKRTFVYAEGYSNNPHTHRYQQFQKDPNWSCHSLPCGHDVMIDMPQQLANILKDH
ncbi:alpha/beta hydrolase [Dongshaea marina]|uniref:alpha/beta hydrolase n=1 Tax=Dongshaea marina TaxID=2047966 RepID=UPI000D3E4F9A|nr:alpha/beta hydrolase [Dongshaea marina]